MKSHRKISEIEKDQMMFKPKLQKSEEKKQSGKFIGNIHRDVAIPQDYKIMMKPAQEDQLLRSKGRNQDDDNEESEEFMPTSDEVQEALSRQEIEDGGHKNISIINTYDDDIALQKSKRMDSFRPSIVSESSDSFSDLDQMSKGMADIIDMRESAGFEKQKVMRKRAAKEEKKIRQSNTDILPAPEDMEQMFSVRRPPEEEFFFMLLTCYKINHAHMSKICDINGKNLFEKAASVKKIPFFEYPNFIEKELDAAYMNMMYQKRKKKHVVKAKPLTKIQKKQRLRVKKYPENLYGKVLDDEYDFEDDYFN